MDFGTHLPNEADAVDLVMRLMAIPGKSGHEAQVAEFVAGELRTAGVPDSCISFDRAHQKSHLKGETGNLIVKLPGSMRRPRRLLMAHLDTVPLCVGSQPILSGNVIRSRDPQTALGGDDRAGVAVVLNAVRTLKQHNIPHPPLTLLFAIQEEIGLVGARNVTASKLGKPHACFNWDGGPASFTIIGATGDDHLEIEIEGIASHAGAHPEDGVSAIAIASVAIASLVEEGWFGKVEKGRRKGTSNIGIIQGGDATNVVTDALVLKGEARSHDPKFRAKIVEAYRKAFSRAAKTLKNAAGRNGTVRFESRHKYESYKLDVSEPVVRTALNAVKQAGREPIVRVVDGGLDSNWMNAHGFPTVTLGCGQSGIHTVHEELFVDEYLTACRIALLIATGAADAE